MTNLTLKRRQEITELLATEILRWEKITINYYDTEEETARQRDLINELNEGGVEDVGDYYIIDLDRREFLSVEDWQPTTDHNHFQQVLEEVMKDVALWSIYCRHWHLIDKDNRLGEYMKATLEEKCLALEKVLLTRKDYE